MQKSQRLITGELLSGTNKVDQKALDLAKVKAYYFSAHWCPPCKKFTPILSDLYKKWNSEGNRNIEIVFISMDKDKAQFQEYYKTMPWLAVPYGDARIKTLAGKFEPEGIPCLLVVNENEEIVKENGYELVMTKRDKALEAMK